MTTITACAAGLGPWSPAIDFSGTRYVSAMEFTSEQEATEAAEHTLRTARVGFVTRTITLRNFVQLLQEHLEREGWRVA